MSLGEPMRPKKLLEQALEWLEWGTGTSHEAESLTQKSTKWVPLSHVVQAPRWHHIVS
ncbi:hypothetical protein E4U14_006263, partial [Claviceps sp. LM454 group G7]